MVNDVVNLKNDEVNGNGCWRCFLFFSGSILRYVKFFGLLEVVGERNEFVNCV